MSALHFVFFESEKRTFFWFCGQVFLVAFLRAVSATESEKNQKVWKLKRYYRTKKTVGLNNMVHDRPAVWSDTGLLAWKLLFVSEKAVQNY